MILIVSIVNSILFGVGVFLTLQRDILRVVIGIIMISNSANLFIIAAGLGRGEPPIYPLPEGSPVSDPLVQAMALTAIVISSSVAALLFSLVYRIYASHRTVDLEDVSYTEVRQAEEMERSGDPEWEQEPT